MKLTLRLSWLAASLFVTHWAAAEDIGPEPDYSITYNVGAVTDYRVRGIAQSNFQPVVQGGIDFAHKSGVYLGTFASHVDWVKAFNGATKGSVETDFYGGYRDAITDVTAFDAGIITYQYPNNNSGRAGTPGAGNYANASTVEAYLNLSYKTYNLKYNRSIGSFLGDLNSSGSQYLDLNASFDLGSSFSLTPHVGHQSIPHQGVGGNQGNYTDFSLSLGKDFGNGLSANLTAVATTTKKEPGAYYRDAQGRDLGKSTVFAGLKYSF